jgi:hypothetical protein
VDDLQQRQAGRTIADPPRSRTAEPAVPRGR